MGLWFFVDGIMQVVELIVEECVVIEGWLLFVGLVEEVLVVVSVVFFGLLVCVGFVFILFCEVWVCQFVFVLFLLGQVLVVLVGDDGLVENWIIVLFEGLSVDVLIEVCNYMLVCFVGLIFVEV